MYGDYLYLFIANVTVYCLYPVFKNIVVITVLVHFDILSMHVNYVSFTTQYRYDKVDYLVAFKVFVSNMHRGIIRLEACIWYRYLPEGKRIHRESIIHRQMVIFCWSYGDHPIIHTINTYYKYFSNRYNKNFFSEKCVGRNNKGN